MREPGDEHKEDIVSGTSSALAGKTNIRGRKIIDVFFFRWYYHGLSNAKY